MIKRRPTQIERKLTQKGLLFFLLISVFIFSFVFAHTEDTKLNQEIQSGTCMMPMMDGGIPMMGYWGFWNWRGWDFLVPIFGIIGGLWLLVILSFPILVLILLILGIIYLIKKLKSEIKKE
jgi:membrane-associated HD superfamily phosphohydrolase